MLQFVREIPIRIVIQKTLSERRGFLFHVSAGFAGEIDPLSGMVVNLTDVDAALAELKTRLESQVFTASAESLNDIFTEIHHQSFDFLRRWAHHHSVQAGTLNFREERDFGFCTDARRPQRILFYHHHYLEDVAEAAKATLWRLTFFWSRTPGCPENLSLAGLHLLKDRLAGAPTPDHLQNLQGHQLPSGSTLCKIEIANLSANFKLSL